MDFSTDKHFYNVVNIIYDVIITCNQYPYTAKNVFVAVRSCKDKQIRISKINRIRT